MQPRVALRPRLGTRLKDTSLPSEPPAHDTGSGAFSILHVSDLHRSPNEPISNVSLVQALVADRATYTRFGLRPPDAIVVSGDIIWGATLDDSDYAASIQTQYKVANDFLSELANRFLDGDRSRVVIVPGNHDVCWNTAQAAMEVISPETEPDDILERFRQSESDYRWSWRNRRFYEVRQPAVYRSRLNAYWDFVESFYQGINFTIPISRERGFNVFELQDDRIAVVAFESIHNNDHLLPQGSISTDVIHQCDILLHDLDLQYALKIAVWHHGINGPPSASDYLDIDTVYKMIGTNFHLGLHGHQHYSQSSIQYVYLPQQEAMAVVGAGSLCAGDDDLPHAVNRQYNVIQIDGNHRRAEVHVREVTSANQFGQTRDHAFAPHGFKTVEWGSTKDLAGRPVDPRPARERNVVLKAEAALKAGDSMRAINLLERVDCAPGTYPRSLFLQALSRSHQRERVIEFFDPPANVEELICLVEALRANGRPNVARETLDIHKDELALDRATEDEVRARLDFDIALEERRA